MDKRSWGAARELGEFESIETTREKVGHASDLDLFQKTFDRMK